MFIFTMYTKAVDRACDELDVIIASNQSKQLTRPLVTKLATCLVTTEMASHAIEILFDRGYVTAASALGSVLGIDVEPIANMVLARD